jgi:hypothetical protein
MTVDSLNIAVLTFSAVMAIAAILTFLSSIKQTSLLKRTLYGEIYPEPPLDHVGFLKPEPRYESVIHSDKRVNYNTNVEGDSHIFEEVILPRESVVRLAFTFRTTKKQSLRHIQFGCKQEKGNEPRVVGAAPWWAKRWGKELPLEEYIDLDEYCHIEYAVPRNSGTEQPFITGFELKTRDIGKYNFDIEIYSTEARKSLKKTLKITVK